MKLNKIALIILTITTCLTSIIPAYSCPDYLNGRYKDKFLNNVLTGEKADDDIEKSIIPRLIGDGDRETNNIFQLVSMSNHQPISNQVIVVNYTANIFCKKAPCPQSD
jgi:hypothetical protein